VPNGLDKNPLEVLSMIAFSVFFVFSVVQSHAFLVKVK